MDPFRAAAHAAQDAVAGDGVVFRVVPGKRDGVPGGDGAQSRRHRRRGGGPCRGAVAAHAPFVDRPHAVVVVDAGQHVGINVDLGAAPARRMEQVVGTDEVHKYFRGAGVFTALDPVAFDIEVVGIAYPAERHLGVGGLGVGAQRAMRRRLPRLGGKRHRVGLVA